MEPAGRYAWDNFKHMISPACGTWKGACKVLIRATWGMLGAICIGLAFAVATLRRKK